MVACSVYIFVHCIMYYVHVCLIQWVYKTLWTPALSMTWRNIIYLLLLSLVKSTSIRVDEGEEMGQFRHGLCMCAIQRVNGQDKRFKCLWMGYHSRCQAQQFVSRTAMLLGFSHPTVSRMYQEWSTSQRTSRQFDNCGKHWRQYEPASLWNTWHLVEAMPQQIEAVLRAKMGVQLNIRKVFLMFCTFSVYHTMSGCNILPKNVCYSRYSKCICGSFLLTTLTIILSLYCWV